MSPPAQNAPPSPRTSTQRHSSLSWIFSNSTRSSRHIDRDMALSLPGCESVTWAMAPSAEKITCPGIVLPSVEFGAGSPDHIGPPLDFAVDESRELLLAQV